MNMVKATAENRAMVVKALTEAEIAPPEPRFCVWVNGYGYVDLWNRGQIRPFLAALARVSGESLLRIVLAATIWEYEGDDGRRDITPPEVDAWHWDALFESLAEEDLARSRRRAVVEALSEAFDADMDCVEQAVLSGANMSGAKAHVSEDAVAAIVTTGAIPPALNAQGAAREAWWKVQEILHTHRLFCVPVTAGVVTVSPF